MRSYEMHVLESGEDIIVATDVGLLDEPPTECDQCGEYLTVPFTVRLGEDDISVSLCNSCLTVPRA